MSEANLDFGDEVLPTDAPPADEPVAGPADELGGDARSLYEVVPSDGSTISNPALREALGWQAETCAEEYFAARKRVADAGLVGRGRCRGGTARRVPA